MQNTPIQNTSLVIEASAGSGKTYQLVNRLVQLLINGANPAHIVAITFTRKAAAEMQARLQERLYKLATMDENELVTELKNTSVEANKSVLSKARHLYESVILSPQTVRCTTFHSFCQEILKRFPFEAEVPPGFELGEQSYLYKQQAWHALMADCQQQPDSNISKAVAFLFDEFGLNNTHEILNSFLTQRSDWWAWTQKAGNPVGYAISRMQAVLQVDPNDKPLETFFTQKILDDLLAQFCSSLDKLKAKAHKTALSAISDARNTKLNFKERHKHLRIAFLKKDGDPIVRKITKEMDKSLGESNAKSFIQIHLNICQQLEQLDNALNLQNSYHINKQWYIAGKAYLDHYQKIKVALRQLDFTDLEWQTYCLLTKSQHALWVQYKLDARINHLLIDEFQDTNPIQWRLLQPLIEEFSQQQDPESSDSHSVLLVGDVKQSIYRFRRAEPKLFPIASAYIEKNFNSTHLPLNASWRSSPAIINFVNKLFSETSLSKAIPDFPHHTTMLEDLPGSVTLLNYPVIEEKEAVDNNKPASFRNPLQQPRIDKDSVNQLEAELIANKITTLIRNHTPVTKNGETRNIQYKDIIILLRNRTKAAHYEKALHQQAIPFVGSERGTLLECLEVNDIIMLLNWLITPFNNIALASILRSPLFSVSDHTLMQLAQINSKDAGNSNWFYKIETLLSTTEKDAQLDKALQLLKHWQCIATQIPVHDLLDVIYSEADVLAQYSHAYPAHLKARARSNLTRLIELALEIDSGRYPSLQQFIAHIEQLKNLTSEAPDTPAATSDLNRVQVMTIHASKGLESAVIFLANADAESQSKFTYKSILDWPAEKESPNIMMLANKSKCRDTITESLIRKDLLAEQREAANVFYVAITRARQHLYISAAKPTKSEADWYTLIKNCYDVSQTEKDEYIIEQHNNNLPTSGNQTNVSSQPLANLIDVNLKKPITLNTTYQDIKKSISPSSINNKINQQHLTEQTDFDATTRGIVIHAIIENISTNSELSKTECQNKLGHELSEALWNECWDEASEVTNFDAFSFIFPDSNNTKTYNEVPVSYLKYNTTVFGIIDRVIVSENNIHIVDYKTHQTVNENNIQEYADYYQPQLTHYQQAAQLIWPEHTIQSYLLFTHTKLLHHYDAKIPTV